MKTVISITGLLFFFIAFNGCNQMNNGQPNYAFMVFVCLVIVWGLNISRKNYGNITNRGATLQKILL